MRKRLIRALIFIMVAVGVALGAAGAAGALDAEFSDGMSWGWAGTAPAAATAESAAA
jgi:hypothetical protein